MTVSATGSVPRPMEKTGKPAGTERGCEMTSRRAFRSPINSAFMWPLKERRHPMRRGKLMQALAVSGVLVLALVVTIGCAARTRYLTVRPPQVQSWEGQPLPLTAALMVSESVRAATDQEQVNCPFSTTNFVFQTGTAFERGAMQALAPVFSKVDLVRERPKPGQFDLVIEPASPDVEIQGHCQLF